MGINEEGKFKDPEMEARYNSYKNEFSRLLSEAASKGLSTAYYSIPNRYEWAKHGAPDVGMAPPGGVGSYLTMLQSQVHDYTSGSYYEETLADYRGDTNGCWICPLYNQLFNMGNILASKLYPTLRDMCIYFLGLWFSFYILFKMVKYYLELGAIDPRKFFPEILKPFVSMIVAIIVILNIQQFYTDFISPLAEISIGFSDIILDSGTDGDSEYVAVRSLMTTETETLNAGCVPGKTLSTEIGLSGGVNNSIQCFLQKISVAILKQVAIGSTFMYGAWHPGEKYKFIGLFTIAYLPTFYLLFVGILVWVTSLMLFLSFSFKLVDGMIRLVFVTALLPLWVACWVLPASKKYATKAFEMFLHVLVNFLFLSVITVMVLYMLDASLMDVDNKANFISLLKKNEIKEAGELLSKNSFLFKFVMCIIISFTLLGKVDSFVSHFISGVNLGIGEKLGKATVGIAIQKPAQKIIKPIVNKVVDKTGKKIASKIKGMFKKKEETAPAPQKETAGPITIRENIGKENETVRRFKDMEEYQKYQEQERQRREKERQEQEERWKKEDEQRKRERQEREARERREDEAQARRDREERDRFFEALNKHNERMAEIERERAEREGEAVIKNLERAHEEIWRGTEWGKSSGTSDDIPTDPIEAIRRARESGEKPSDTPENPDDGAGKK